MTLRTGPIPDGRAKSPAAPSVGASRAGLPHRQPDRAGPAGHWGGSAISHAAARGAILRVVAAQCRRGMTPPRLGAGGGSRRPARARSAEILPDLPLDVVGDAPAMGLDEAADLRVAPTQALGMDGLHDAADQGEETGLGLGGGGGAVGKSVAENREHGTLLKVMCARAFPSVCCNAIWDMTRRTRRPAAAAEPCGCLMAAATLRSPGRPVDPAGRSRQSPRRRPVTDLG
ncbi:hypothetical protein M446_0450 [Methylobacterium sp. 4-46]|nr:hypothetical protein M446_0450 [Methylobacterium sp. 4-46]